VSTVDMALKDLDVELSMTYVHDAYFKESM